MKNPTSKAVKISLIFVIVSKCAFCGEIDNRKIPQVSFGVVSCTAIITGWSLFFYGESSEEKSVNSYQNAKSLVSSYKYHNEIVKYKNLSKTGAWTQGIGGICIGASFLWRLGINKSTQNTVLNKISLIPGSKDEITGLTLCFSY